uniref:J domain-containing protein n=1 Tax=Tetraselmis sp. GSL018 TaxID=582737 RepID=A0A061QQV6_9CHLO
MKLEDAYKVLGLERGCDGDDIRRAFRKQALIWHPDKNSNNGDCTERFQRIQAAYAKLTRELSEHYADDSDDEYCDEFVNDDDDEDCDYDCDCFFHGGIPPWEFFEQLFAAMESGHYGPPQGGFAPRQEAPRAARHSCHHQCDLGEHCMHHCDCEADPHHCEYAYGFESRDERRHREREEQKLEKMWRKEMEMAERESIRAANAAKAAKSLAQERNLRAWMRQMPRPTMASRSDTTIELLLTRRGIANDELPVTCVCKMEWRKSNDSAWSQRLISKDEYRVTMEGLDPGTMYVFRICGGRRNKDRPDEWGEVSVESRYATTGKPPAVQSEGGHVPERSKKHGAGRGGAANRTARVAAAAADKPHRGAAPPPSGGPQSEEDRLRQQEKELAIQKALEAPSSIARKSRPLFWEGTGGRGRGVRGDAKDFPAGRSQQRKEEEEEEGKVQERR